MLGGRMSKGPSLTWDDRQKIRMIRNQNKGLKPKELLPLVEKILKRKIAESTLSNELGKLREYERIINSVDGIDHRLQTWNLGSVTKYPIPADVIPILLKIKDEQIDLNIWQAQWIARLNKIILNTKKLYMAAFWFAVYEESWEMSGDSSPCDTTIFDSIDPDEMLKNLFAYIDLEESKYKKEAFEHQIGKRHQPDFGLYDMPSDYENIKDSLE
jgi:hypothetical protein